MSPESSSAPESIGGVLDRAFRVYRSSFSRCWLLALGSALASAALGIAMSPSIPLPVAGQPSDPAAALQAYAAMIQALSTPPVLISAVLVVFVSSVLYGAIMVTVSRLARGDRSFSMWDAISVGLRRFPTAFLASLLWGITVAVGFMLVIIPGIYFAGKLTLWTPAVYVDGAGPGQALSTSWRLTRGRWWRGVIILSVTLIFVYVIAIALSFLGVAAASLAPLAISQRVLVIQGFQVISNVLLLPLIIAVIVAMYHDFKLRSEGGDLATRMAALGKS